MDAKAVKISDWKASCDQRWLLLLNAYPLAESDDAITHIGQWLSEDRRERFDGVFWSAFPDRSLIAVPRQ
jgi:hypothetical protein